MAREAASRVTAHSRNMDGVATSATLALLELIHRRRSEGRTVLARGLVEWVLPAPPAGARAAIESVRSGVLRYGPVAGAPALRECIAEEARRLSPRDGDLRAANVVVSNGSKQALFNACFVLFGEGDEVLIPTPGWTSYYSIVRLARARPVAVLGDPASSFKVDADRLRAASTPNTPGVILNSPCNPTAAVYSPSELADIVRLADEPGWGVISDEIYRELAYDETAVSLLSVSPEFDRLVVTNGMSKAYAMPRWRVGWSIAPAPVTSLIVTLQSQATAGVGNAAPAAALAVLSDVEGAAALVSSIRNAFPARGGCPAEGISRRHGLDPVRPPCQGSA